MNEKRKFIREYVEARGGVKELGEDEKNTLAKMVKESETDAE